MPNQNTNGGSGPEYFHEAAWGLLQEFKTLNKKLDAQNDLLARLVRIFAPERNPMTDEQLDRIEKRLGNVCSFLDVNSKQTHPVVKNFYTVAEAAEEINTVVKVSRYTLRVACETKRIVAEKWGNQWRISHAVVEKIKTEGLPPITKSR